MTVSTPEGLRFNLKLAGPYVRAQSFGLDLLIQFSLVVAIQIIVQQTLGAAIWLILLAYFAIQWLYSGLFEWLWDGQTPGKRAMGIQAVQLDGTMLDFSSAMLRNLIRSADMFFFVFAIGHTIMGFSPRFQRLGDLAASTVVIYKPRKKKLLPQPHFDASIIPRPASRLLTPTEQDLLREFSQRYRQFSATRSRSIAELAWASLFPNLPQPDEVMETLLAISAWNAGHRPQLGTP